ncbi:MAG TPA: hypothetical protein VEP46_03270 [Vicinamibacterales bacterium]|nr:hypothetical protein [Vicinamibacterales bacterium]
MHTVSCTTTDEWARLVRAEYLEVPGLDLTRDQVRRLWGLDQQTCDSLLAALLESRFLKRTRDNRYLRADGSV